MQKFSASVFELLEEINRLSNITYNLLVKSNDNSIIEEIESIYAKRAELIDEMMNMKEQKEWEIFFVENKAKLFEKIDDIQGKEVKNIEILADETYKLGNRIKDIMKSKSLLIYSK